MKVNAYCFMPDHVHVLLMGLAKDASVTNVVARWKQATAMRTRKAPAVAFGSPAISTGCSANMKATHS